MPRVPRHFFRRVVGVSLCVWTRFYDFRNRGSERRETGTYVAEMVCPRVSLKNFDVSSRGSIFRIFEPVIRNSQNRHRSRVNRVSVCVVGDF